MPILRISAHVLLLVIMLEAIAAAAQDYPNKSIRIVTSGPGGNGDFNARLIAQEIAPALGQPVIVDNRAGGVIPGEIVAKATADGYTLLAYGSSLWTGALLEKTPYDPIKDFVPITRTSTSPYVLVVHPSVSVKSVPELVALAKARPGALNYASASTGTPSHLAGELFNYMAGLNIVRVPYGKGEGAALIDLFGGHVQLMFVGAAAVAPHVKSGKLNALAVTSAKPSALFPGLPTVAASAGVPGYELGSVQGIWAPAKTPVRIVNRLNQEIVIVLNKASVRERYLTIGAEVDPCSPGQFAQMIETDVTRIGRLIKIAGIKVGS